MGDYSPDLQVGRSITGPPPASNAHRAMSLASEVS